MTIVKIQRAEHHFLGSERKESKQWVVLTLYLTFCSSNRDQVGNDDMQRRVSSHFDLKPVRPSSLIGRSRPMRALEMRWRTTLARSHINCFPLQLTRFRPCQGQSKSTAKVLCQIFDLLRQSWGLQVVRFEQDQGEFKPTRVVERKWKTTFAPHGSEIELIILCTHYRGRQLEIA